MKLESYVRDAWAAPGRDLIDVHSAVTGDVVAQVASGGLDMGEILGHARKVGGPNLRMLTFHQRAEMIKKLAQMLTERKEELYKLSFQTGATRADGAIDIEGGIGTMFVYASKGRRELPNSTYLIDGDVEQLSKAGNFVGQHIVTSLQGAAVHINAFNFPCWGTLEKLAPALLAGVPVVTKPATVTSYVTAAMIRMIVEFEHPAAWGATMHHRLDRRSVRPLDRPGSRRLYRLRQHRGKTAASSVDRASFGALYGRT